MSSRAVVGVVRRRARVLALAAPLVLAAVLAPWLAAGRAAAGPGQEETPPPATGQDEPPPPGPADPEQLARGQELFATGCSSCHGPDGRGVVGPDGERRGPSLEDAGTATAYYYLATGRMPLADSQDEAERKPRVYSDEEIDALVAYVATFSGGRGPSLPDVDLEGTSLARGGEVFRLNCQPCHSATGSGGALSFGQYAPRLAPATPLEVAAAVRSGPGQMPTFGPDTITDEELDDLVRYVEYLRHSEDPGGVPIGRTGPIPEGFVAWLLGMVTLLVLVAWIGTRSPIRRGRT